MHSVLKSLTALLLVTATALPAQAAAPAAMKADAAANVDANTKLIQQMVDQVFSYAEPGFQEYRQN